MCVWGGEEVQYCLLKRVLRLITYLCNRPKSSPSPILQNNLNLLIFLKCEVKLPETLHGLNIDLHESKVHYESKNKSVKEICICSFTQNATLTSVSCREIGLCSLRSPSELSEHFCACNARSLWLINSYKWLNWLFTSRKMYFRGTTAGKRMASLCHIITGKQHFRLQVQDCIFKVRWNISTPTPEILYVFLKKCMCVGMHHTENLILKLVHYIFEITFCLKKKTFLIKYLIIFLLLTNFTLVHLCSASWK